MNGWLKFLWNFVVLLIVIIGFINKIFYKVLNRLFWFYWGYDLDVFKIYL